MPSDSPFLDSPPSSPWRTRADFHRRAPVFKRVVFLAIIFVSVLSLWMLTHGAEQAQASAQAQAEKPVAPIRAERPVTPHRHAASKQKPQAQHVNVPVLHDDSGLAPEVQRVEDAKIQSVQKPEPEPVTFALLMWSRDSASEGVILIKSILMYASTPTHIHIICDEHAQSYLEERLALVTRPRNNVLVRFYRPTYKSMEERVEREGSMTTIHSAGVVGLMKLFIHEILPTTVTKAIFVDTDAFFISDPLLLWQQFDTWNASTAISMPSHPELSSKAWLDANKICSCVMLLDLAKLRALRLIDSSAYRASSSNTQHPAALSPPAFTALFGPPDPQTGKYRDVWLGDQSYWWAIVRHAPQLYAHLPYDWEVSSCLVDMYMTGLGDPDASADDQRRVQHDRLNRTPQEGGVVVPRLLHFNCLPVDNYYDWPGWNDQQETITNRWGTAVRYHVDYKWYWLNAPEQHNGNTTLTIETVHDVVFADIASVAH